MDPTTAQNRPLQGRKARGIKSRPSVAREAVQVLRPIRRRDWREPYQHRLPNARWHGELPAVLWFGNRFTIGLDHAQPQARLLFLPATSISRRPSLTVHPHNKNAIDLVRIECDTSLSNERIMTP